MLRLVPGKLALRYCVLFFYIESRLAWAVGNTYFPIIFALCQLIFIESLSFYCRESGLKGLACKRTQLLKPKSFVDYCKHSMWNHESCSYELLEFSLLSE